jgi:hypothetical protein
MVKSIFNGSFDMLSFYIYFGPGVKVMVIIYSRRCLPIFGGKIVFRKN